MPTAWRNCVLTDSRGLKDWVAAVKRAERASMWLNRMLCAAGSSSHAFRNRGRYRKDCARRWRCSVAAVVAAVVAVLRFGQRFSAVLGWQTLHSEELRILDISSNSFLKQCLETLELVRRSLAIEQDPMFCFCKNRTLSTQGFSPRRDEISLHVLSY